MQINKVAVLGAGTMGSSIAVALIGRKFSVVLKDVNQDALNAGLAKIDSLLEARVKKGLSVQEAQQQRALIQSTTDYGDLFDVDLVIEAVAENIDVKRAVFGELDKNCNVDAILASNTSSLPISQLAAFTHRPDKVVGLHFFNPAHLMKLVEVVAGLDTSPDTIQSVIQFGQALDKLAIRVEECPSFLVNRLLGRYMNEALWCLQDGIAGIEQIDKAAVDFLMPIGPLALRDMNGADIGLAVARFNYQEYGERFKPATILERMVEENLLGQKVKEGFYLYNTETRKRSEPNPRITSLLSEIAKTSQPVNGKLDFNVQRLFLPMINEAFLVLQEKVADAQEIDPALMAGLGMRKGPLALAADMGLANCLKELETHFKIYGERFRPAPLLKRYVWAGRTSVV